MKRIFKMLEDLPAAWVRGLALLAGVAIILVTAISCGTVTRKVVMLPDIPGAKYIGSKACEECHEEIYKTFQTADHSRLIAEGPNSKNVGCESCHGPGSIHSESGGESLPPYSFTSGRPVKNVNGALSTTPVARATDQVCFTCHGDVRGQFNLASHHPVPEGRMTCTECHSPHKGFINKGGSTALLSQDANCLQCHPSQKGPYVFEHEAMHEGCTVCHTAHGSVNAKMLTVRDANLCLKCHFQQVQSGKLLIGGSDHTLRVQQGSCWTAGCHEAIHGSRVNSSLRY
jgi:predicted CXXCH cytochrome family protein